MLVLCRRISESVCIGEEVTVTVLSIKGNQVRFGIAAPRSLSVDRGEIWFRKQEELPSPAEADETLPESRRRS